MRDLSKTEILYVLSLIASFVLFFLSVGVLMGNTTSVVVPYISLTIAIALSLSTLILGVFRKPKTEFQKTTTETKPIVPSVKAPIIQAPVEKPVVVDNSDKTEQIGAIPVNNEPRVQVIENNFREQKIEPIEQLITVPEEIQKIEESTVVQPKIEVNQSIKKPIEPAQKASAKRKAAKSNRNKKTVAKQETIKEKKPSKQNAPN